MRKRRWSLMAGQVFKVYKISLLMKRLYGHKGSRK
jgi:hypothetical protein